MIGNAVRFELRQRRDDPWLQHNLETWLEGRRRLIGTRCVPTADSHHLMALIFAS
jgi:hypothetical protein